VVTLDRKQRLLIFGGVGATNAVSLLDPVEIEWTHPAARAAQKDMERARRRKKSSEEPEMLLPCARFGHTAVVEAHAGTQRLIIFGGADFKGALGDVYELNMSLEQPEWSSPEITGLAPPPSVKHCAALVRGHMVLISGEKEWGGHVWALRLQPAGQMMWLRSAVPDFPLLGISRHAMLDYVRPRAKAPFTPVTSDPDAVYERVVEIDLGALRPMVAKPPSPENLVELDAVAGIEVDQVYIGSCAGGRLEDLRAAAAVVRGHQVHPRVRMIVVPTSQAIWNSARTASYSRVRIVPMVPASCRIPPLS
jgi:hypothetical protein